MNKSTFYKGDTIQVNFKLDSMGVIYSNFGGCGNGPYYLMTCHSDSTLTRTSGPCCDYLIETFYYIKEGSLQFIALYPGVYSLTLYVLKEYQNDITPLDPFKYSLSTKKFEIVSKIE